MRTHIRHWTRRSIAWNAAQSHQARSAVARPRRSPRPSPLQFRPRPFGPALLQLQLALQRRRRVDPRIALLPVNRTPLPKLILELKRIQYPLRLVHTPPHIRVVDRDTPHRPLRINNKQRPLRHPLLLDQNPVIPAQPMITVADKRDVDPAEPAFHVARGVPGFEAILGVRGGEDDGARPRVEEFFESRAEGFDFRGTDEGEGFGEED